MCLGIRGRSYGVVLVNVANFYQEACTHDVGFFCVTDYVVLWSSGFYLLLYPSNNFTEYTYKGLRLHSSSDWLLFFDLQ